MNKYICTWDADKWVWTVEPDDPDYDGFAYDGTVGRYHIEADNEADAISYAGREMQIDLMDQRYP